MGQEKALVEIRGQSMIATAISILGNAPEVGPVVVVTNTPERFSFLYVPLIGDYFPYKGPLAGIHAALRVVQDWVFVTACDMPFLSVDLPGCLWSWRDAEDLVVPWVDGHWATTAALYGPNCLPELEKALDSGSPGLANVLEHLSVRRVSAQELSPFGITVQNFFSVNTPQDVKRVNSMMACTP